jgi:alpha/beta superfamily hydrolase
VSIRLPGARDVRATLDSSDGQRATDSDAAVVACPPHPQFGGDRHDSRLRAIGDALGERGVDCLRIDYGSWDDGRGERADAETALAWTRERYDRVGLCGYSFGGAVALAVAADAADQPVTAVLSPAARVGDRDVVDAVERIERLQVVYGTRDDTVACERVAERAREAGATVEVLPADHFFVGQQARAADAVAAFLADTLGAVDSARSG